MNACRLWDDNIFIKYSEKSRGALLDLQNTAADEAIAELGNLLPHYDRYVRLFYSIDTTFESYADRMEFLHTKQLVVFTHCAEVVDYRTHSEVVIYRPDEIKTFQEDDCETAYGVAYKYIREHHH